MYLVFLRVLYATCLLFSFWPVLRIFGLTTFDCLTPITIVFGLAYQPKERGPSIGALWMAIAGVGILGLAGVLSDVASRDPYEHIQRVVNLVVALAGIIGLAYMLANRKIFSVLQVLTILCVSASCSSAVAILQGRFGILTGIIPAAIAGVESTTRMTGLAEHPIEAGISSAFGAILAIGLAFATRKRLWFVPLVAINAYAMEYSASLTALFALMVASIFLCFYIKAYKILIVGLFVGIAGIGLALSRGALGLLTGRLEGLIQQQGNYATLRSREMQWGKALELIEPSTIAVGNGYSISDLPYGMDIHNGLVASIFHFGLLGLVSQVLLIAFFITRLEKDSSRIIKSILVGCIIIFCASYLTGPALSRRSLWVPLIILGSYLSTHSVQRAKHGMTALRPLQAAGNRGTFRPKGETN